MDYRSLGRTGISVSQLCLGAMMFGAFGNPDHDDSIRIIHRALDAGINFIDTADGYSAGESELIVGKALAGGRREGVVLAVKFGVPFDQDPNHRGAFAAMDHQKRSRARCADFKPTGSTSTKSAFPIRTLISTKPSAPCLTSCALARFAPSARRRFLPHRSWRPNGPLAAEAMDGFALSNPPTRS